VERIGDCADVARMPRHQVEVTFFRALDARHLVRAMHEVIHELHVGLSGAGVPHASPPERGGPSVRHALPSCHWPSNHVPLCHSPPCHRPPHQTPPRQSPPHQSPTCQVPPCHSPPCHSPLSQQTRPHSEISTRHHSMSASLSHWGHSSG